MVKFEKLKNKEGVTLKTKEGVELIDYRFEDGDIFIPCNNSVIERKNIVDVMEGKKKVKKEIINYSLKCVVKGFEKEKEIFVTLTPAQATSLKKKIADGVLLNQNLFCAYNYPDKKALDESGEPVLRVGVGFKNGKSKRKDFADFEEILNSDEEE